MMETDTKPHTITKNKQGVPFDFLRKYQEKQLLVSIYLVNGICLKGYIWHYDEHTLLVKGNDNQPASLLYFQAVSTIL